MTPRPRLLALNEVEVSLTVKQDDQPVRGSFASDEWGIWGDDHTPRAEVKALIKTLAEGRSAW